ncbi:MAG: ABC transporter substrate-binding protein [Pseudomonadota bacterium]|nr:ABC transporter substrate-binding protein [Pseudomonadota bacterium]
MRNMLKATVFALATGFLTCPASAADEFKIGGILALSGPFGLWGESMRQGAELAAEMHGGEVLGKPIVFEWQDSETKPQVATQKAVSLIANDADFLFGAVSSSSTLAIMKLAERRKIPLISTISAAQTITGADGNPWTFRTSNSEEMEARMVLEFAKANDIKRVHGVLTDYAPGRNFWDTLVALFDENGIEVDGVDFVPLGTVDFSVLIEKLSKSEADALMTGIFGADGLTFLKQAAPVGLKEQKVIFGSINMDELIGEAVEDAGLGVASTLRYHFSADNARNRAFVDAFVEKYGRYPDQYAGEAFDGIAWFLEVIDRNGSEDAADWIAEMNGSVFENSIEGVKTMRSCDNQAEQPGFMGVAVTGEAPLPAITMDVTYEFPPEALFQPC